MQLARDSNWSAVPERLSAARWCRLLLLLLLLLMLTRRQYVLARKQNLCARLHQDRGAKNVLHMFTVILVILHELPRLLSPHAAVQLAFPGLPSLRSCDFSYPSILDIYCSQI
jgi:hypothetical protein